MVVVNFKAYKRNYIFILWTLKWRHQVAKFMFCFIQTTLNVLLYHMQQKFIIDLNIPSGFIRRCGQYSIPAWAKNNARYFVFIMSDHFTKFTFCIYIKHFYLSICGASGNQRSTQIEANIQNFILNLRFIAEFQLQFKNVVFLPKFRA